MYVCLYVCMYACMHVCMYASDDDDIEERYLAAEVLNTNVAGCQCNYGRHDTVTVTGKHHDTNCAGFSKDVKQPHSSETHRRRDFFHISVASPRICIRFFPHWVKALAPDVIDCLTHCRAVRHAPVLRPRSSLEGHLRQLQRHRGFMRAILLLHDSCNSSAEHEPQEPIYST